MKLLISADLHFRLQWFRWLIEQAPDFDLVCIAGDLLDMFNVESTMGKRVRLAGSSGSWQTLFPSLFVPGITTMLADSFRMIGRQCTNGSSISARTGTSSPMVQRKNLKT